MEHLHQSFTVKFEYNVFFTTALFDSTNDLLNNFLTCSDTNGAVRKILFVVDEGLAGVHTDLLKQIKNYF